MKKVWNAAKPVDHRKAPLTSILVDVMYYPQTLCISPFIDMFIEQLTAFRVNFLSFSLEGKLRNSNWKMYMWDVQWFISANTKKFIITLEGGNRERV